ncbi:MAG: tetratricopeptide repeat protein [Gemmataceae bacterium]|nr:tetratricopeptide repeat protein [Gemmataceae bacterium]
MPTTLPPSGVERPRGLRRLVPNRWLRLALAGAAVLAAAVVVGRHAWAYYHLRAARADAARYRFADARRHLESCLRVWHDRADVWLLAGQVARRGEDYEMAERCYAEALRQAGGTPTDDLRLEQVLLQAQLDPDAKAAYLRGRVEDGHPQTVPILEALARGYLKKSRYAHAGFVLQVWLEKAPDDPAALYYRGTVREEQGPREEAVDDYRRVLELDPAHDAARLRLVKLLRQLSRPAEARDALAPMLAGPAVDPRALVERAECEYALGERAAAEATARAVLAALPDDPDALVMLGRCLTDADRFAEAEEALRRAIRARPSHFQAHSQLHRLLAAAGREAEAAAQRGEIDRMTRDITRLRDILSDGLARSPRDPGLHVEVGRIFLRAGEPREGLRWLDEALRLDPTYRPAHAELAAFYDRHGDKKRADEHRRQAE